MSEEVPQFIKLGTPLYDINDVKPWAESVKEILGMIKADYYSSSSLIEKAYRPNVPQGVRHLNWNETLKRYSYV